MLAHRLSINPFSAGTVLRRQILTIDDGYRTGRIKIFIMAVDLLNKYSNEAERATKTL